ASSVSRTFLPAPNQRKDRFRQRPKLARETRALSNRNSRSLPTSAKQLMELLQNWRRPACSPNICGRSIQNSFPLRRLILLDARLRRAISEHCKWEDRLFTAP